MNKKQLIVAWIVAILICITLFMEKDTILVEYNKDKVDKLRAEHIKEINKEGGFEGSLLKELDESLGGAESHYPYKEMKPATNILGLKIKGEYFRFRYKSKLILSLLIIGSLLIYTLRNKKK